MENGLVCKCSWKTRDLTFPSTFVGLIVAGEYMGDVGKLGRSG